MTARHLRPRLGAAAITVLLLAGCATLPPGTQPDPRDPFERTNRAVFRFNETMDKAIAAPVARTYNKSVPRPLRQSLSNVLANASYPRVIVSQLLQGKLRDTGRDTGRLLINSVIGLGGMFDVATDVGLERNDEDFGQVLGKWGFGDGPYLMLPVLGPSTLRDVFGMIPDQYTNATHYIADESTRYGVTAFRLLDDRANLLEADKFLDRAADPYVLIRSVWLQKRAYEVRDGDVPLEPEEFEDPADENPAPDAAAEPAPPSTRR